MPPPATPAPTPSDRTAERPGRPRARPGLHLRDGAAVLAARVAAFTSRASGRNATAVPGFLAERLSPGITARLAADLSGVVLVSGTNGKTSTSRFLVHVLGTTGHPIIANRSGANLEQAVASTLVAATTPAGRLGQPGAIAVLEVDEAALPAVARILSPSVIVLTNLFRDQLDRFGETDHLVRLWARMLDRLPPETVVAWCADDPRLAALVGDRPGAISYGLIPPEDPQTSAAITRDVSACPVCGAALIYRWTALGHLGDYACPSCGFRRPDPWLTVRSSGGGFEGQTLAFRWPAATGETTVRVGVPSLGNAYNAAAALTAAVVLGVDPGAAATTLASASVPFARFEEVRIDGRRVILSLVKNPASLGELTRLVAEGPAAAVATVLFLFSDNFQDGRDVSWYWDIDPSPIARGRAFVIAGRRGPDFELRLKYELVHATGEAMPGYLGLADTPAEGLARALAATPPDGTCVVVSTYTALLSLRAALVARGLVPAMPR